MEHKTNDWERTRSTSLSNFSSKDGKMHGSGTSHASPKQSFRAPWRMVDTVTAEEVLDGQHQELTSLPMPELLTRASCRIRLEEDLC